MNGDGRLVLHELTSRPGTTQEIANFSAIADSEVGVQARDLNERLRRQLGLDKDPIEVSASGAWRVDGIAGLVRLNDQVELEIVPKFLDPTLSAWRMDFFVLAVLVRTGHLLAHDEISADSEDRGALATLVARSLLRMHEENERRPIRSYRRRHLAEFSLDGDVDWETLQIPAPDGFRMDRIELTRTNAYNATLKAALDILTPEVNDLDTQAMLGSRSRGLHPQSRSPRGYTPLPARHASWSTAYELSQLVVDGLGLDLATGRFAGPGFVLPTWLAWQQLCEYVVHRALPDHRVRPQKPWKLGQRSAIDVNVRPDLTVEYGGRPRYLLDAKYKTRAGKSTAIVSGDLYESLAFLRATDTTRMVLLYPSQLPIAELSTGEWRRFDRVTVDESEIEAVQVQVQGLATRPGLDMLVEGARAALIAS